MPEILAAGSDRPPWSPRRRAVTAGLAAAALAAGLGWSLWPGGPDQAADPRPGPSTTAPAATGTTTRLPNFDGPVPVPFTPLPIPAGQPAALAIGTIGAVQGSAALERRDRDAAGHPWGLVVRRDDGSFGRHGAVITFPVAAPHAGRAVVVGDAEGAAADRQVTWPVAGGYARIRGDLPERDLIAIARTVRVRDNRPVSDPPADFRAVVAGQYEPSVIRELRFGSLAGTAFGLTYTGVLAATGFEDQLYAGTASSAGTVGRRPAVASAVGGGSGTIAWEPVPGVVAYVGYSGTVPFGPEAVARLRELAEQGRLLSGRQWQELQPGVNDQNNAFGFDDFG